MTGAVSHKPASAVAEQFIAEQFVAARLRGGAVPAYPGGAVPQSLESAYRCQDLAIDSWPDRIAGWKVARVGAAWLPQYVEERLIGPVFEPNIHWARAGEVVDCPVFEGGFAAVEAEIVLRVGEDAPADKTQWTLDEAAELVSSLHVGVEVASSPLATLNDLGPGAVASDFGNNWGIVVGPAVDRWRPIAEIVALSFIDDAMVGRGTGFVRQGALGALVFTLTKSALRGRPLRAGTLITTGMITGVHDISIGQQSRHIFEGCGEVRCRATRAETYKPAAR